MDGVSDDIMVGAYGRVTTRPMYIHLPGGEMHRLDTPKAPGRRETPVRSWLDCMRGERAPFALRAFNSVWVLSGLGPGPFGASADSHYIGWVFGNDAGVMRECLGMHATLQV